MVKLGEQFREQWRINLGCLILAFLMVISIAFSYASSEHTFYAGDFAPVYYHNNVQLVISAWRQSPSQAMVSIWQSLGQDHNQLFVLPLLPLLLMFGDSRTNYIISVAVAYLLPLSLVMGAIASRLVGVVSPLKIFWLTTFVSLLLPMTWLPTLRGYPDAGGALIMGIATLLLLPSPKFLEVEKSPLLFLPSAESLSSPTLSSPKLFQKKSLIINQTSWVRVLGIGLLLGLAILFRRHFAYADLSLIGGLIIQGLVVIIREQKQVISRLILLGMKIALMGAIALFTLMITAREFTNRALTTDFRDLYASWSLSFPEILVHYLNFYGWLTWGLVILGFGLGIIMNTGSNSGLVFIISAGIISLFNLLVVLRYDSFQYTLHSTPFVILGLVLLGVAAYSAFAHKLKLIIIISSVYLGLNLLFMLTGLGKVALPLRSLLAANYPPQVRQDYQQIQQLTAYLRQLAPNKEPIYVVSSSAMDYLSRGILNNAEATTYGKKKAILNFLRPQSFDSSSSYPLESLLNSKYVVVPQPIQYRFAVEHHDVARIAAEIFTKDWEFAQDFRPLPETFTLENGAVVRIYQRIRFTSIPIAIKTLVKIKQEIKEVPGGQGNWITLSQLFPLKIQQPSPQIYNLTLHAGYRNQLPVTALIYLQPLPDIIHVKGLVKFLDQKCLGISLKIAIYNQQGQIVISTETLKAPQFPPVFFLSSPTKGGNYLVLQALSPNNQEVIDRCTLEISNLTLEGKL